MTPDWIDAVVCFSGPLILVMFLIGKRWIDRIHERNIRRIIDDGHKRDEEANREHERKIDEINREHEQRIEMICYPERWN